MSDLVERIRKAIEFDGQVARNQKMGVSGALTIAVDAFEQGARWQSARLREAVSGEAGE